MEEESIERGGPEVGSKPPSKVPAFFVILHPSHGDGSKEEGILVANRDVSSVAPFITTGASKSKSDFFLSSNCTSGEITVTLDNNNMWNEFYRCNTEMVLTKQGRRMFPYCRYWISGLTPHLKYILVMDITPLDNYRYKWNGKCWEPAGNADPHVLGRVFIHPESPSTGQYWMHQPISFYKLKLTNNILDQDGHIILHSMHRYLPRLHVIPAETVTDVIQLNGPDVHTFAFPQTEFIAVTAYQNFQITQLKIDCNPFAKGFKEGTVTGRPCKDFKQKSSDQEVDSSISKSTVEENEDSGNMKKLQELFRMSEYLDGDKENEAVNSEQDFLKLSRSASEFGKISKQTEEVIKRVKENFYRSSLAAPVEQPIVEVKKEPIVEVKKEPEDDYDYNKPVTMEGVAVKQEQSDAEVTDDHYNSDVDYPILEKHFAKFKEEPYSDEKYYSGSPTGVAKAKLLKLEPGSMPVLHLESCAAEKNLEAPDLQMPVLSKAALQDMDVDNAALCTEKPSILPNPSIKSEVEDDGYVKVKRRRRVCKNKIDEIYATLQTALRTSRGPKRKFPSLFPKPSVTPTPGSEGTVTPIAKKRGRPPKPKLAKVGRPPKIHEAPRLLPDFNPDLEDVDGVLFVAFSSKEALDVHTEKKPTETVSTSISTGPSREPTVEMQKILGLERQLLIHLKTMKYRQVIHPALQQVGIKLNIVDPSMSIDLRYLGVELPLLYITGGMRYDDTGLCGQASGLPFVSRTGKTTDYTKIKGWRDKFSAESATSSQKIEGGRSESSVKNLSAFCSDELDEYLENEAKLMGDLKELSQNEPESSISYQLPTKSSSYVRTLDSVLKKQAQQAVSSVSGTEQVPLPRKKRKYTRRVPLPPKSDSKPRSSLQAPLIVKEKSTKPYSSIKKEPHSPPHFLNKLTSTPISPMEYLSKSQPMLKPLEGERGGTVQHNKGNSVEEDPVRNFHQVQLQSHQVVSKPIGVSRAQIKLIDLEEGAVCEGKPRTYITEERAELSLSTLLTAQASLKNKPIQKLINKRINSCNNDFCRLGCICSSLGSKKHLVTHCRHETCMFSSDCQQNTYSKKHGMEVKPSITTDDEADSVFTSMPGYGYTPVKIEPGLESLDENQIEEHQGNSVDGFCDRAIKGKKRKSYEIYDETSAVRTPVGFPIWNRSDVADDPEPLCIPEQAEPLELKIVHKAHMEKVRSPGGGKPGRPSTVAQVHEDPVYLYFDSMMTCARVRVYSRKTLEEKKVKDQSLCDSDANGKEQDLISSKANEQEKEANKEDEVVDKRIKSVDSNASTKLIEIISDCCGKEDESKVSNITSQHVTSSEPQSFKLGSFDIELTQENKSEEKSTSSSVCSRVKIAMSAEKQANSTPPKPVKWKAENVKPPDKEPEDSSADKQAKSHGGKGLPFYTKVRPAGKLVARLKTSNIGETELVEVNGKSYPQAKLLLGQMGALHPANRLAAYVTRRLQPSLFHLPKVSEVSGKMATKSPTAEEKSEDICTPPQKQTAAQSRPSSMLTHFVMGEVGSMQKSLGVSSSEPTILGSPKQSTHSTRLLFVSSAVAAGKPAPAISTTSTYSTNLASLSTTSLSSAALSSVSASKGKATPSLPTLMRVTKIVTKGSSLSLPAGIVVPSTNDTVLPPPALTPAVVKPLATTGNTSSDSLSSNPGINKSIGTPISNVIVSPNVTQPGSVSSQIGLNITSPLTVKTVAASSASTTNSSGVTTGKRLGPRLLLIPVNSSSASARPVQRLQTSPGQKMVLQPIKSSNGATLFRHPSGQLIQLVPLQVNSANSQQGRQQIVIRNSGSVGVRLPLPTNPKAAATSSISIPASIISRASAPAKLSVGSPPKVSFNKSGVTILSQNPPMLSPLGTFALKASSPKSNSEAPLTSPKVITFGGSRHGVIAPNVLLLQSGNVSLANNPPSTVQNDSPVNPATKSVITRMGNTPDTLSDPNKQDKALSDPPLSLLPSGSGGEKHDKEDVRECDELPASEIVSEKEAEEQESTEEQTKSVTQEVNTSTNGTKCQNGQQEQSKLSMDPIDEFLSSDVTLLQEAEKKDVQSLQTRKEEGPEEKRDGQQSPANKNIKSQVRIEDTSPVSLLSKFVKEQVAVGEQHHIQAKREEKAEESHVSALSCDQDNRKSLRADPQIKQDFFDDTEILENLDSEDESDVDDFVDTESSEEKTSEAHLKASTTTDSIQEKNVKDRKKGCKGEIDDDIDIETVEELSEKINLAHLKASATSDNDNDGNHSKGHQKGSKVPGEDTFSATEDDSTVHVFHRPNHKQNERRRRRELRDLFGKLKNTLGLHNLLRVSKSYILKQAIKETMNLTDAADTLIKKKMMLSQTQTQLIRKVSNLSGKPKEVVLKKLEYLYAKQKAMEAEMQTKNLEDDVALHKESMDVPLPRIEPFLPLKLGEDSNETESGQTKKPIILTRKPGLFSKEGTQQSEVCTTSNVLLVSSGHPDDRIAGQVAGIPPTLIQTSPVQVKSGTSMVIQLPSTIELKSIIGNSPLPISLSTVPANISIETSPGPASEKEDAMMPKIVNVTSLALGAKSDMASELGIVMSDTERGCQSAVLSQNLGRTESCIRSNAAVQDVSYLTADSFAPSTSLPTNKIEDGPTDPAKKTSSLYSSLLGNVPQENDSSHTEAWMKSKAVGFSDAALAKMVEDSGLELELKKLTSAIDEAGLDPSELSDSMGDPEDAEETFTSLLDEMGFLNEHLKDTGDNYGPNFPSSDAASSKLAGGGSSPFSFGNFKEAAEIKEKPTSFSPLFMRLEEGEIRDSIKHKEEAGSTVSYGGARKVPPPTEVVRTQSGLLQPPTILLTPQKTENSCPDVFWRPMPKLAPLGLKSHPLPTDQRALANKSMPSLASVAARLSSPKTTN